MKNVDLDKRLSAYLDGALADAKRERFARELAGNAALQRQLKRSQALSGLVREAWSDGPVSPAPEFLIASLRPQLAAISRERRARPAWQQSLEHARQRLSAWWSPMPLATSAVAAFMLAIAFMPRSEGPIAELAAQLPSLQSAPIQSTLPARSTSLPRARSNWRTFHAPFAPVSTLRDHSAAVYDMAPGENPAMLFQTDDGSTMLWLFEDDDLSLMLERTDRWG